MKKVSVELFAFYGYGCSGCSYDSEGTEEFEVSDQVADLLMQLREAKGENLNQDDIIKAIAAGHGELQELYDAIEKSHRDMVVQYWLFEADNDCIDESLEPYFWEDIADGTYVPEKSIDEVIAAYREENPEEDDYWDWDKEEDKRRIFFDQLHDEYLDWVNSHTDAYWFIAERVGLDLDAVYDDVPELEFTIDLRELYSS